MSASLSRQWLDRAGEDLTVAKLVLAEGHTAHACFLSQQCIEKSLKAHLLAKSGTYPRTHKLVDLVGECASVDAAFSSLLADCAVIDQYYIPTRYPDGIPGSLAGGMPGQVEAEEAVGVAERVIQFVTLRMI